MNPVAQQTQLKHNKDYYHYSSTAVIMLSINKVLYLLALVLLAQGNVVPEGVTEELSPGR